MEKTYIKYISDVRLFNNLNESARETTKNNILKKLVKSSADKYQFIDFTEFEKAKGDITKFKYYNTLSESINILYTNYKEVKEVEALHNLFVNLHNDKKVFVSAFANKNAVGIMMYNTIFYGLFEGTSYIISNMVEFVDRKAGIDIVITKMRGTKSNIVMKNIMHISDKYQTFIELMNMTNDTDSRLLTEASVAATVRGALTIIKHSFEIIPNIRELLFMYYYTRIKISDAAEVQATFLEANAARLEDKGEVKAAAKQQKVAKFFNKIASKFAIAHDKGENEATKEYDSEEINDDIEL